MGARPRCRQPTRSMLTVPRCSRPFRGTRQGGPRSPEVVRVQHPDHTTRLEQCGGRVGRVTEFVIGDRLRSDPVGTWVDPLGGFVYGLIARRGAEWFTALGKSRLWVNVGTLLFFRLSEVSMPARHSGSRRTGALIATTVVIGCGTLFAVPTVARAGSAECASTFNLLIPGTWETNENADAALPVGMLAPVAHALERAYGDAVNDGLELTLCRRIGIDPLALVSRCQFGLLPAVHVVGGCGRNHR